MKLIKNKSLLIFSDYDGTFTNIDDLFKKSGRNDLHQVKGTVATISKNVGEF